MAYQNKSSEYLKVKIETAKPTELLIMLFDGALRFTTQAKAHIEQKNFDQKNELLLRAQAVVLELLQALDPTVGEELYEDGRVELYNLKDDPGAADDALKILEHLRETWRQAIAKAQQEQADAIHTARDQNVLCLEG